MRRWQAVGAALALGCATREVRLELDFDPNALSTSAHAVEVYVASACPAMPGEVPAAATQRSRFRRGDRTMALSGPLPDTFVVGAIARDRGCALVAAGCVEADRSDAVVRVPLTAVSGMTCAACDDGFCGAPSLDAGLHDASGDDTRGDAGRDGGADAGPVRPCDCREGTTTEACPVSGGRVVWESALRAPGTDAFRGLTRGGDGALYANGWFGSDPFNATEPTWTACGTTMSGGGRGWLLTLSAADGRCTRAVPSGLTFAAPSPTDDGVALFGDALRFYPYIDDTTSRITASPPAAFGVGFVVREPSAGRAIVVHQPGGGGDVRFGSQTVNGVGAGSTMLSRIQGRDVLWMRSVAGPALAAVVDSTRWAFASAAGLGGCPGGVAGPRIETRRLDDPDMCTSAVALPFAPGGYDKSAMLAHAGRVWYATRTSDDLVRVATVSSAGEVVTAPFGLAPGDISPLAFLAPGGGDEVYFAAQTSGVDAPAGLGAGPGGYVVRLRVSDGALEIAGVRRFSGGINGMTSSADGRTVYVASGHSGNSCTGIDVLEDGEGALLITAVRFD